MADMRHDQPYQHLWPAGARTPLLGFAAYSGTGKTTLLRQVIPQLREADVRVGLIKHSHHGFDVDKPGKDSYELRHAGAGQVLITSSRRWALMTEREQEQDPVLEDQLAVLHQDELDLILVEGFKRSRFPKIELYRAELGKPLLHPEDAAVIAVASDAPLDTELPQLDLNDPAAVTRFILEQVLGR